MLTDRLKYKPDQVLSTEKYTCKKVFLKYKCKYKQNKIKATGKYKHDHCLHFNLSMNVILPISSNLNSTNVYLST